MNYLDTNVFVLAAELWESSEESKKANALLERVIAGSYPAATSLVTWNEIVWVLKRLAGKELALKQGKKFLEFPNLSKIPATAPITLRAQLLAEKYDLKPFDATHAATCIERGIINIVSEDADFDRVKEIRRIPISKT